MPNNRAEDLVGALVSNEITDEIRPVGVVVPCLGRHDSSCTAQACTGPAAATVRAAMKPSRASLTEQQYKAESRMSKFGPVTRIGPPPPQLLACRQNKDIGPKADRIFDSSCSHSLCSRGRRNTLRPRVRNTGISNDSRRMSTQALKAQTQGRV